MPSFLATALDNINTQSVLRYVNGTPATLGTPPAGTLSWSNAAGAENAQYFANHAVQFRGELFAFFPSGVYKLQPDGTTWSRTLANGGFDFAVDGSGIIGDTQDRACFTGFHPTVIGGVPHLVGIRHGSSTTSKVGILYNSNTKVWSEGTPRSLSTNVRGEEGASLQVAVMFRGVMHFMFGEDDGNPNNMATWDPATDSMGLVSHPLPTDVNNIAFCVFEGRLFMVYPSTRGAAAEWRLAEFTGGSWNQVAVIETNANFNLDMNGTTRDDIYHTVRPALFTNGTNMYAIIGGSPSGGGSGWRVYRIDNTITPTHITASGALPATLVATGDGGSSGTTGTVRSHGWRPITDIDSTPGTLANYLFYNTGTSGIGSSVTLYLWNGESTPITEVDSGGDRIHSLPMTTSAVGGERLFVPGELDVAVISRTAVVGGEQLSFIAYGDPVVISHGGITGTINAGDTVTGNTSGATATVVSITSSEIKLGNVASGPFQNGETIYETLGVNEVTASSAPSGGAADKTISFRFNTQGEPPTALATLTGSATGGTATRSGNTIINVIADGVIEYSAVWDVSTDGLVVGQRFDLVPYIT